MELPTALAPVIPLKSMMLIPKMEPSLLQAVLPLIPKLMTQDILSQQLHALMEPPSKLQLIPVDTQLSPLMKSMKTNTQLTKQTMFLTLTLITPHTLIIPPLKLLTTTQYQYLVMKMEQSQ